MIELITKPDPTMQLHPVFGLYVSPTVCGRHVAIDNDDCCYAKHLKANNMRGKGSDVGLYGIMLLTNLL